MFQKKLRHYPEIRFLHFSVIKTILRRDLENIEIPIPDKKMQDIVINLFQNKQAQQKLLDRKKILINQIIESSITNYLK